MSKTILVAALNWGIGHATRDIPIINRLLARNCRVLLASDGAAKTLWEREFPQIEVFSLPSWNIKYQKRGSFLLNMARRTPHIFKAIADEKRQIQRIVKQYDVNGIISDNRFGVWHPKLYNVFITHQIDMKLGPVLRWAESGLYLYNKHQIKKFQAVWVPDFEGDINLSGSLSHHHKPIKNIRFLGPLSRFVDSWNGEKWPLQYDVTAVLSGVEPQRTFLEDKLIDHFMKKPNLRVLIIQGLTHKNEQKELRKGLTVCSFMATDELMKAMLQSNYIVCRSGYSTVLDLAALNRTALMIPTPGQTEQEYLAKWLQKEKLIAVQHQNTLDIDVGLETLKRTKGFSFPVSNALLDIVIDDFLTNC